MKLILTFLIVLSSFTLFARLKSDKIGEAFAKAHLRETKETFFCVPGEISNEIKTALPEGTYGPYNLMLKGIPPGTRFGFYQCNLFGVKDPSFFASGYIDANGEAWIKRDGSALKLSNCMIYSGDVLPGEPIYSLVVLDDKKTYIADCNIPVPLEAYGKNGRHVTMEIINYSAAEYLTQGENFTPNEEVTIEIHSKNGIDIMKGRADKKGKFMLFVKGNVLRCNQLETDCIKVTTPEQRNPMTISYDWKFLEANEAIKACNKVVDVLGKPKREREKRAKAQREDIHQNR